MPDSTILCGKSSEPEAVTVRLYKSWGRESDKGWARKPDFIRRRLRERYIDPIEQLPRQAKHGFLIMAVSCLLIETLEAFHSGWTSTRTHSSDSFDNFFSRQVRFSVFHQPGIAVDFYENVRCALLHQGETRNGWTLRRSGPLLDGKTINATKFHREIARALDDYCGALGSLGNSGLRKNFDTKMNFILKQCL